MIRFNPIGSWSSDSEAPGAALAGTRASMNLRLGDLPLAGEEVEVAAFVGLADMGGEHGAVAAHVMRRRLLPGGAAAGELLVADMQMDAAGVDVDLDLVAGLHEGERAADITLRRH